MNSVIRVATVALSMSLGVAAYPAHAEMKFPEVGKTIKYQCTSRYGSERTSTVVWVKDGVIREEGFASGRGETFVEQRLIGIGTTLFIKRDRADSKGVRGQKFDEGDFEGYEKLEPGSKFSGTVKEWNNRGVWNWSYSIEIGERKTINHGVFGEIEVVPVTERRSVDGGSYKSELNMLVYPERGLELDFNYKGSRGDYECDVVGYE